MDRDSEALGTTHTNKPTGLLVLPMIEAPMGLLLLVRAVMTSGEEREQKGRPQRHGTDQIRSIAPSPKPPIGQPSPSDGPPMTSDPCCSQSIAFSRELTNYVSSRDAIVFFLPPLPSIVVIEAIVFPHCEPRAPVRFSPESLFDVKWAEDLSVRHQETLLLLSALPTRDATRLTLTFFSSPPSRTLQW